MTHYYIYINLTQEQHHSSWMHPLCPAVWSWLSGIIRQQFWWHQLLDMQLYRRCLLKNNLQSLIIWRPFHKILEFLLCSFFSVVIMLDLKTNYFAVFHTCKLSIRRKNIYLLIKLRLIHLFRFLLLVHNLVLYIIIIIISHHYHHHHHHHHHL